LLERIAKDLSVHARLLESVDERRGSWLREAFEGFLSVPGVEMWGLYWHFVDIVWIFLLPLLYLIATRKTLM